MHQGPCVSRGLMVDLLRVSWSETWEMHQRYFASMARIIGCRNDCVWDCEELGDIRGMMML